MFLLGIPQQALIHNAISPSPGIALLNVSTREAGVTDGEAFEFIVQANVINDGTSQFFVQEVINYVDSSAISLIVSGLLPGIEYQFSVKVKNKFGASEFSSLSALSIQESVPQDQISIGKVIAAIIL